MSLRGRGIHAHALARGVASRARSAARGAWRRLAGPPRVLAATDAPSAPGALLSYLATPVRMSDGDGRLAGHTNAWECRTVGRLLQAEGLAVDAIDWSDADFTPARRYRVLFDLHRNLDRLAASADVCWLHVTGSHPRFAHAAEVRRRDALADRRGVRVKLRRAFDSDDIERFDRSIERADFITALGDDVTIGTLGPKAATTSHRVSVTASEVLPRERDDDFDDGTFLWFAGSGAVHKGMDLVLDVFARNPALTLHCIGPYGAETDFVALYGRELHASPNIVSHGWLLPSDPRFRAIARRASAFVLPSCSESQSTAAATCMMFGLVPIVTPQCGMALPSGLGHVVPEPERDLERAVVVHADRQRHDVADAIGSVKRLAAGRHSREAFAARMHALLVQALASR